MPDFTFTPEQDAWRAEVRAFLDEHFDPELRAAVAQLGPEEAGGLPEAQEFHRKVGERGWFGLSWPEEYGGLAKSSVEQLIFSEEFEYAGAPMIDRAIASTIGLTLLHLGSEEDKQRWVPGIVSGEIKFVFGYSEPDAGTDLASLSTRAELDGDEWVINGQKIWNSAAHYATHEWLAVRTDPEAPKHHGISVLVVPLETPGITVQPLLTWSGMRTNATYFDDVRVPRDHLVGELDQGWTLVTAALALERANAFGGVGEQRRLLDELIEACNRIEVDGEVLARRPEVALRLAELVMDLELARLLAYRTAAIGDAGEIPFAEASMVKVFTSEFQTKLAGWGMEILGAYGQLAAGDEATPLGGALQRTYQLAPVGRFGAGTNEIQRDIIAQRGLGLPRAR